MTERLGPCVVCGERDDHILHVLPGPFPSGREAHSFQPHEREKERLVGELLKSMKLLCSRAAAAGYPIEGLRFRIPEHGLTGRFEMASVAGMVEVYCPTSLIDRIMP